MDLAYAWVFSYGEADEAGIRSEVTEDLPRSIIRSQEASWYHHAWRGKKSCMIGKFMAKSSRLAT